MSTVFGLMGGIASGKSAVGRLIAGDDGLILAADEIAHQALDSEQVRPRVVARFGPEVVGPGGTIDRAQLARQVFADAGARRELESWIHPIVRERICARLDEAQAQGVPRVVLDVPLLLENDEQHGFVARCDHLVFIETSAEARDQRAILTRGWSPGEVERREATQLSLDEKRRRADLVIPNHGTLAELEQRVQAALAALDHESER